MNRINLSWTPQGWMANFKDRDDIRALFGTTYIPTAFTAQASAMTVTAAIQALNPGADVWVMQRA